MVNSCNLKTHFTYKLLYLITKIKRTVLFYLFLNSLLHPLIFRKIALVVVCCLCFISQAQENLLKKAESFQLIDSAIYYAEKYVIESESKHDTLAMIDGGICLAKQYYFKSKYNVVEKIIFHTLELAILKKQEEKQAKLYQVLAASYQNNGENVKAIKTHIKAIGLYEKVKSASGLVTSYTNLGEFYRKIRQFNEAKTMIRKGLAIYDVDKKVDSMYLIGLNNRFAAIMNETGYLDSAIYYSNKAIVLCQKLNNKSSEAISLNEKGLIYKKIAQPDSAILCYQKAEAVWASIGADYDVLTAMRNRALVYSEFHYPKKLILETNLKLIDLVNRKKINFSLEDVYSSLSHHYLEVGNLKQAYLYQQKYYEARMEVLKKIYDAGVNEIKEKYENDKIKKDFTVVSSKLEESELVLAQQRRESAIVYSFAAILLLLILFVVRLLYQRNKINKTLKQKNSEKDILIQEIHHRVKNNLQFVSSLINMQINSTYNSNEAYSLNDASRRIKAMALVHEMLYNQNEMKGINIQKYLLELVDSMNELVNSTNIPIQFNVDADSIIFDTQRAIAIGMITSELVSNSIKYAFSNTNNPAISIELKQEANKISYSVQDNGDGFKDTNEQRKKLGMRLISIFSRQLKGEYAFENNNGYKYTITFKY